MPVIIDPKKSRFGRSKKNDVNQFSTLKTSPTASANSADPNNFQSSSHSSGSNLPSRNDIPSNRSHNRIHPSDTPRSNPVSPTDVKNRLSFPSVHYSNSGLSNSPFFPNKSRQNKYFKEPTDPEYGVPHNNRNKDKKKKYRKRDPGAFEMCSPCCCIVIGAVIFGIILLGTLIAAIIMIATNKKANPDIMTTATTSTTTTTSSTSVTTTTTTTTVTTTTTTDTTTTTSVTTTTATTTTTTSETTTTPNGTSTSTTSETTTSTTDTTTTTSDTTTTTTTSETTTTTSVTTTTVTITTSVTSETTTSTTSETTTTTSVTTTTTSATTTTTSVTTTTTTTTTTVTTTTAFNSCTGLSWSRPGVRVAGTAGSSGSTNNMLNEPVCVYVTSNNTLYVCDSKNDRIMRYNPGSTTGTPVINGGQGTGATQLYYPTDLTFDKNGNMYVVDSLNCRVQRYPPGSSSGTTVAGITGSCASGANQLNKPMGIAVDDNLAMYVMDTENGKIWKYLFNSSSRTDAFGGSIFFKPHSIHIQNGSASEIYVTQTSGGKEVELRSSGASTTNFTLSGGTASTWNEPVGVTVDPYGNIYIADYQNKLVRRCCAGQTSCSTILDGASSSTPLMDSPYDLAFDNNLNLYVAARGTHAVYKFTRV